MSTAAQGSGGASRDAAIQSARPAAAHSAYVALGANLDEPQQRLQAVMAELAALPRTRLAARSSLYRTAPMVGPAGDPAQPDFFNAVVRLETGLTADELLDALQALEHDHGRVRSTAGAPRTLDLDLLLYGDETRQSARLTLPHPRMHLRRFVLEPLLEIAPDCVIPGQGPALAWHARTLDQRVERIEP